MTDWVTTVADLGTAGGTALLAVATFFSTRSANAAARSAERSLLDGLRPILFPSRWEDPVQKVTFIDQKWMHVRGGHAALEIGDEAAYLVVSLRNAGRGVAVLHGWDLVADAFAPHRDPEEFHRLNRDIYVPPADNGFCQVAVRDLDSEHFRLLAECSEDRERFAIDILYGDLEGGQRIISRMVLARSPAKNAAETEWAVSASRHWNLDRADPR